MRVDHCGRFVSNFNSTHVQGTCLHSRHSRACENTVSKSLLQGKGVRSVTTPSPAIRESQCMMMSSHGIQNHAFFLSARAFAWRGKREVATAKDSVRQAKRGVHSSEATPDILYRLVQQSGVSNQ